MQELISLTKRQVHKLPADSVPTLVENLMATKKVGIQVPMPFDQQEMGRRIALAREGRGMNQAQLGDLLGVTKGMISHYELGKSSPGYETLTKMAESLGKSVNWLLFGDETEGQLMSREEYELFKRTSELPPHIQHFVLLAIEIAAKAQERLPRSILAEPTPENWLAYAEELYKAYNQK